MNSEADKDQAMSIDQDMGKELVHTRQITCRGYRRKDGLWQIEASVADEKGQAVPFSSRPAVLPGELIHHFSLCVLIDDDYLIRDAQARTLAAPWAVCTDIAADYRKLIGLRIGPGFTRAVREVLGGTLGCTHLRELLQQMATTAYQTIDPARAKREADAAGEIDRPGSDRLDTRITAKMGGAPAILNTCIAYRTDSPVVQRRWPQLYTGPATPEPAQAE